MCSNHPGFHFAVSLPCPFQYLHSSLFSAFCPRFHASPAAHQVPSGVLWLTEPPSLSFIGSFLSPLFSQLPTVEIKSSVKNHHHHHNKKRTHSNIHQHIGNSLRNWPFLVSYPQSIAFIYDTGLTRYRYRTPSQNSLNNMFTSQWRGSCSFLHRYLPYIMLSVNKTIINRTLGLKSLFPIVFQ